MLAIFRNDKIRADLHVALRLDYPLDKASLLKLIVGVDSRWASAALAGFLGRDLSCMRDLLEGEEVTIRREILLPSPTKAILAIFHVRVL